MSSIELARSWFDMCRTGDESRLADLVTDDLRVHGPGGNGDRDTFAAWLRWYPIAFSDQDPTLHDVIESGDRMVVRYSVRSIYRGGYLNLPSHNQPVRETGIVVFRLSNGRVAESWFEGNDLEVIQQLGGRLALPPDPKPPSTADHAPHD